MNVCQAQQEEESSLASSTAKEERERDACLLTRLVQPQQLKKPARSLSRLAI